MDLTILGRGEKTYKLSDFCRILPDRPNPRTAYNWCKRGRSGVKLEFVPSLCGMRTSLEAYQRFLDQLEER